jgi:hypothetical protein
MRWGFWKEPAEMSVGHTAEAEVPLVDDVVEAARVDVAAVAVAVGIGVGDVDAEEEEGPPRAVQPNPILRVTISQPSVGGFVLLKIL